MAIPRATLLELYPEAPGQVVPGQPLNERQRRELELDQAAEELAAWCLATGLDDLAWRRLTRRERAAFVDVLNRRAARRR